MKVAIIGAGKVGRLIANSIRKKVKNILIIEKKREVCDKLAEKYDWEIINGDATDPDIIEEAKINEYDIVFITTGNSTTNILTAMYLKHMGANRVITRLDSNKYIDMLEKLGIEGVSEDAIMAREMLHKAFNPIIYELFNLSSSNIRIGQISGREIGAKTLKEAIEKEGIYPVAIWRNGTFIMPKLDEEIFEDDIIIVLEE